LPDSPSKPTSTPASAPRREKREHPFNAADFETCKRIKLQEIELKDRNSVLRGDKVNVSLELEFSGDEVNLGLLELFEY
jgi:hypothetical protein